MIFQEYSEKDYNLIIKETFDKISSYDSNFTKQLELFKMLDNNYDKELYTNALNIIVTLLNNYRKKNIEHKIKLFRIQYKPLILGINNNDKYEETDFNMYIKLQNFEKELIYFMRYATRIMLLSKEFYRISLDNINKYIHNNNKISSVFITLKSIELFQFELDEYFSSYNAYIDAFSSGFEFNVSNKFDYYKPELLRFYLENINKYNEKKVKHLHF